MMQVRPVYTDLLHEFSGVEKSLSGSRQSQRKERTIFTGGPMANTVDLARTKRL